MIPKGNQRAGGRQLATHLMNAYDNERVEIAEVRGAVAQDLHGAFAEWRAEAGATKCRKYLYSLSLNPDPAQAPLSREQYLDFITRTEQKLGLADQPRAIVFHTKYGRQHCHVVWSRIDTEKMKAVQISHDHQKLRSVARQFARDHHLRLPPGMEQDHGKDRFAEHAKVVDLAEKQQEERTGVTKDDLRREMTAAWKESDTGRSFVNALEQRGFLLARGDRRAYVVVDLYGEVHSLSRYIQGATAKDVKARLSDYPLEKLPPLAAAQDFARRRRDQQLEQQQAASRTSTLAERAETLKQKQKARRDALAQLKAALLAQHERERSCLKDLQAAENAQVFSQRQQKQPRGVVAFLSRITGINVLIQLRYRVQDQKRGVEHRRQTEALRTRHARELVDFRRRLRALRYVEKREARSHRTALRREQNLSLRQIAAERFGSERGVATRVQRDFSAVATRQDPGRGASPMDARRVFNEVAERSAPTLPQPPPSRSQQLNENARDITRPIDPLEEALRRRSEQKKRQLEREQQMQRRPPGRDRGR